MFPAAEAIPKNIWIVIPAHNRKEMTMGCLSHLKNSGVLQNVTALVVDDGSTDGTSDAVREAFPECVLLHGDGNLWWTGAITLGMKHAMANGARCIVWLNDDCRPAEAAITQLIRFAVENNTAASGVTRHPEFTRSWYGGFRVTCWGLKLASFTDSSTQPVLCDAFGGNFVAIASDCIKTCGYPETQYFPHHCGDVSYTLKISRKHGPIYMLPQCTAEDMQAVDGAYRSSLLRSQTPIWPWLRNAFFGGPRSSMGIAFWHMHWRMLGLWGILVAAVKASRLLVIAAIRLLLPYPVRRRLFS